MSTDAQTQAIPRVPAAAIPRGSAAPGTEIATHVPDPTTAAPAPNTQIAPPTTGHNTASAPDAAVAAAASDAKVTGEEPVQQVYEAAMARLNALHDGWAAAMAGLRDAHVDSAPGEAAA